MSRYKKPGMIFGLIIASLFFLSTPSPAQLYGGSMYGMGGLYGGGYYGGGYGSSSSMYGLGAPAYGSSMYGGLYGGGLGGLYGMGGVESTGSADEGGLYRGRKSGGTDGSAISPSLAMTLDGSQVSVSDYPYYTYGNPSFYSTWSLLNVAASPLAGTTAPPYVPPLPHI